MRVLGIESSCDETGVALYDSENGLLAQALYSQISLHTEYGGVVPELASRVQAARCRAGAGRSWRCRPGRGIPIRGRGVPGRRSTSIRQGGR